MSLSSALVLSAGRQNHVLTKSCPVQGYGCEPVTLAFPSLGLHWVQHDDQESGDGTEQQDTEPVTLFYPGNLAVSRLPEDGVAPPWPRTFIAT
jgi:hypothetical protein